MNALKQRVSLLILALVWLHPGAAAVAAGLDNWQWQNPRPQGNELLSVAYGNGTFVAVGNWGTIVTSSDGINWSWRDSRTTNFLAAVTYGNGTFVAVGAAIVTSTDGVHWTRRSDGNGNYLYGVTYTNDRFVAVGMGSAILQSSDGEHWSRSMSGDMWYAAWGGATESLS